MPFIYSKKKKKGSFVCVVIFLFSGGEEGAFSSSRLCAAPLSPPTAEGMTKVRVLYYPYKRLYSVLSTRQERQELCNVT